MTDSLSLAQGGPVENPGPFATIRDSIVYPIPGRIEQIVAALNRASVVATPPATTDAPTFDAEDNTATEGDTVAVALASMSTPALLEDAFYSLESAEASLRRALTALSRVGVYDPARPNVDRLFVGLTCVKNELVGVEEMMQNLGVRS